MESKYLESTLNRPEGDRLIDASVLFVNFEELIRQLKSESAWDKNDRNGITVFKNDRTSIVLTCLHKDASMDNIQVDGHLSIQVLDGKIEVEAEKSTWELKKEQMLAVLPGIIHSIHAKKGSAILITTQLN